VSSAADLPEHRSIPIDQLGIGDAVESTRRVSVEDILSFAEISGDFNPIHIDPEFARTSQFGRVIAHGPIALGLAGNVVGTQLPGLGTIAISSAIRHLRPIYADDCITTRAEISAMDLDSRRVTLSLSWVNQDGKLIAEGETVVMPPREPVGTGYSRENR
jgi:acyl dehydratase